MTHTHPASASPRVCPPWRGDGLTRLRTAADDAPDCRGEALQIFTTIFVRPALELREPIRRLVHNLANGTRRDVA